MSGRFPARAVVLSKAAVVGVILLFFSLGLRLAAIQVRDHDRFARQAARQHRGSAPILPDRGQILDRNGEALAFSNRVSSVGVNPQHIPDSKKVSAARDLSALLDLRPSRTLELLSDPKRRYVELRRRVDSEATIEAIRALEYGGVEIREDYRRYYPSALLASHVVGFVDNEGNGASGAESAFNSALVGTAGARIFEKDGQQRRIETLFSETRPERPGRDVWLTIDRTIQYHLEEALSEISKDTNCVAVTGIVIDPGNGEVLALANRPTFDPNDLGSSSGDARRDRSRTDPYPPGSTFKPFIVAAALENRVVTPESTFDCENGTWTYKGRTIRDVHRCGQLSLADVVVQSSNIGMCKVALKLGIDGAHDWIRRFGFGRATGFDLVGESAGKLTPRPKWTETYTLLSVSFGQEMMVTPLQLAAAYSAFGNGGSVVRPHVLLGTSDEEGRLVRAEKEPPRPVLSPEVAATVRSFLERVVSTSRSLQAAIPGYRVAGKTGTAQKFVNGRVVGYLSSFMAFAPADRPAALVYIVVNEPRGQHYYGSSVAAPGVRKVLEATLRHLDVPPDDPAAVSPAGLPPLSIEAPRTARDGGFRVRDSLSAAAPPKDRRIR